MKTKPFIVRQGDVLLRRLSNKPDGASKPIAREHGLIILAHGEVTGHAHKIDSPDCELVEIAGLTILDVQCAIAALTHEEHAAIEIPQGTYEVVRQREYSPTEIRRVAD